MIIQDMVALNLKCSELSQINLISDVTWGTSDVTWGISDVTWGISDVTWGITTFLHAKKRRIKALFHFIERPVRLGPDAGL